jgi:hypothetical protein
MKEIVTFALRNPAVLLVPAVALVLALVLLRIKKRYLNQSTFFRSSRALSRNHRTSTTDEGNKTPSGAHLDLTLALSKIHELALADGGSRYAYWYQIGQLLRRAVDMQAELDSLGMELERCRAKPDKPDRT